MFTKKFLTALAFTAASLGYSIEDAADAVPFELSQPQGKYIVELENGSNGADATFDSFRQDGLDVSINNQFDSPVFNGVSLDISNYGAKTLEDIKALPGVKDAWQASYVTLDFDAEEVSSAKWNPHAMTGVDKVHQNQLYGDGILVAVIDSGVDYNHESLSGSLVQGYDFTRNPRNPSNDASDCIGHGTFVSSVIAGHSASLLGVAPQASIKLYKVFGCSPTTTDDIIIAALLKAYSESPDVISLSLGSDRGYPSLPISLISAKIAETIPVVYAAGNSGEKGLYHASSGASGKGVIAVASVDNTELLAWSGTLYSSSGHSMPFQYVPNEGSKVNEDGNYTIDFLGDLCHELQHKNSSNSFMAGFRGNCSSSDIAANANNNGYMGVLLFSSQAALKNSHVDLSSGPTQLWGMSTYDALYWMHDEHRQGNSFWMLLSSDEKSSAAVPKPKAYSGVISSFTSWGPTFEQNFYPHIAAPGGNVLGAKMGGGYSIASGTSFACPYISGVISLYLSANGRIDPQELRNKVIGSGRLLSQSVTSNGNTATDKTSYAPLIQQGNGIIDAFSLFETKTKILSSPYLELNDTTHRVSQHTITVMNDGEYSISYSISARGLPTVYALGDKNGNVASYYPKLVKASPSVSFSKTSFTLDAGEKTSFEVTISPPNGLDASKIPLFEGAIDVSGNNGELVTVPYMGVEVDTHEWTAWVQQPLIVGRDSTGRLRDLKSYNHMFCPYRGDSPIIYQNIRFGSKFVSFDLVLSDFNLKSYKYPMRTGTNGFYGPLLTSSFPGGPISFPLEYTDISPQVAQFGFQGLSDGSGISNGKFKILCRALKPFGVPENFADWQLYLSDAFTVYNY